MTIALIQFDDREPCVFLAHNAAQARRAATRFIISNLLEDIDGVDEAWMAHNPTPNLLDPSDVEAWLAALHKVATGTSLSVLERGAFLTDETYLDVRS
jgi:hypothetical protein